MAVPSSAARCRLVHLHFYMHDIIGGPGQTAVRVVRGQGPPHPSMPGSYFGDTAVIDDLLTEGPSLTSKAVGRAQGTYVLAAMDAPVLAVSVTVVITEGPYNGSTLVIAGRDDISQEVRELAVVGGTGQLRRATGHVVWRSAEDVSAVYGAGAGRARDGTERRCCWSSSWMGLAGRRRGHQEHVGRFVR
uniref:Dirigent protein n=1 Tax=Triticum urartu TaxID=4572 RepID=A0A8R7TI97_TRIUA